MQKIKSKPEEDFDLAHLEKPQSAPRGLLLHYILFKISVKPSHGYELLQEIEDKTEGAWRPGSGSVYPLLKKLESRGFIVADSPKGAETSQRVYRITPKGLECVGKMKEIFGSSGQKWGALRRIFTEMLEPKDLGKYFVDGTRTQFDIARETLESKLSLVSPSEAEYILDEYALNLKRQRDWAMELLNKMKLTRELKIAPKISERRGIASK